MSGHQIRFERSGRHVRVSSNGTILAETDEPVLLHETGLPTRYYIPANDVRMELLTPTKTHTTCPFKGVASYWSARVGDELLEDVAWSYREPIPEAQEIAGLLCFYDDRVDLEVEEAVPKRGAASAERS